MQRRASGYEVLMKDLMSVGRHAGVKDLPAVSQDG